MRVLRQFSIIASAFVTFAAFAGGGSGSGNGGVSVVCRNRDGKITSAKLLDLWEADQDPNGHTMRSLDATFEGEIERGLKRMATASFALEYDVRYFLKKVRSQLRPLANPTESGIPLPSDFNPRYRPKGNCAFEAAAEYTSSDEIRLDPEIFARLSPTDQAGLYLHEATYSAARENRSAKNSDAVRNVIGAALGDGSRSVDARAILERNDPLLDLPSQTEALVLRGTGEISYEAEGHGSFTVVATLANHQTHHAGWIIKGSNLVASFTADPAEPVIHLKITKSDDYSVICSTNITVFSHFYSKSAKSWRSLGVMRSIAFDRQPLGTKRSIRFIVRALQ